MLLVTKVIEGISGGDFKDVPALAGNGGKLMAVKSDATGYEYVDAPAGVTDHAALDNLGYAESGHTGFAAAADMMIEVGEQFYSIQSRQIKGAGQITLTNGSDQLVGTGTTFIGDEGESTLAYWYAFSVDGIEYEIASIEDETHATLAQAWDGTTQTIDLVYAGAFALNANAIAIGLGSVASGERSTALGGTNKTSGDSSVAVGGQNDVSGEGSVAIGNLNTISSVRHFAIGEGLVADTVRVAVGMYNEDRNVLFAVGNGTDDGNRKNAFEASDSMIRTPEKRTIAFPTDPGVQGEHCWDDDYEYRCIATDTWERWARSTW